MTSAKCRFKHFKHFDHFHFHFTFPLQPNPTKGAQQFCLKWLLGVLLWPGQSQIFDMLLITVPIVPYTFIYGLYIVYSISACHCELKILSGKLYLHMCVVCSACAMCFVINASFLLTVISMCLNEVLNSFCTKFWTPALPIEIYILSSCGCFSHPSSSLLLRPKITIKHPRKFN